MKIQSKSQLRFGIFVAIGLVAAAVSILMLGGDSSYFKKYSYLYVNLDQVQGISRGSIVSLAGFTIGNVDGVSFSDKQKDLIVKLRIQSDYLPRVKEGAQADVRTQGALGDKYIYITQGAPEAPSMKDGDTVQAVKAVDILTMLSEKGNEAGKLFDIIDEVYKMVKAVNLEGRADHLMSNLVDISQDLRMTTAETRKLIYELHGKNPEKISSAIEHLDSVLAKIDNGDGTLGALINDPSLHERLKTLLGAENHKQSIQSLIRTSIEKSEPKGK